MVESQRTNLAIIPLHPAFEQIRNAYVDLLKDSFIEDWHDLAYEAVMHYHEKNETTCVQIGLHPINKGKIFISDDYVSMFALPIFVIDSTGIENQISVYFMHGLEDEEELMPFISAVEIGADLAATHLNLEFIPSCEEEI